MRLNERVLRILAFGFFVSISLLLTQCTPEKGESKVGQLLQVTNETSGFGAVGARFIRGDPKARVSWYLMPGGSDDDDRRELSREMPIIFLSAYDRENQVFAAHPEKLAFQYLRAADIGSFSPLMPLSFSLAVLDVPGEFIISGVRPIGRRIWSVFAAYVVPANKSEFIPRIKKFAGANYGLASFQAPWLSWVMTEDMLPISGRKQNSHEDFGVWDVRSARGQTNLYLVGTTRSAEAWFSSSQDNGSTWKKPVILSGSFAHPSITELPGGKLLAFGVKVTSLWESVEDFRPACVTGPLYKIEMGNDGTCSQPSLIVRRSDILNSAVCRDNKTRLYLVFDCYPEGIPELLQDENGFKYWGEPKPSAIFIVFSTDQGRNWSKPVQITTGVFEDSDPDIVVVGGRLVVTFTRRKDNVRNIWAKVLTANDIGLEGEIR